MTALLLLGDARYGVNRSGSKNGDGVLFKLSADRVDSRLSTISTGKSTASVRSFVDCWRGRQFVRNVIHGRRCLRRRDTDSRPV